MALIDINVSIILLGQVVDLIQGCNITIHGEHSISNNDSLSCLLGGFEILFQVLHVQMLVPLPDGLCQPDPIDDGGMIESVTNDGVLGPEDCLEEASIGIEPAGEKYTVLQFIILSNDLLQLFVNILGAAYEPDRTHAEAMRVKSLLGSLDEPSIVGET